MTTVTKAYGRIIHTVTIPHSATKAQERAAARVLREVALYDADWPGTFDIVRGDFLEVPGEDFRAAELFIRLNYAMYDEGY